MKLSHIGVAVKDLDSAVATFSKLFGRRPRKTETVADQHVRIAFIPVGEISMELTEPTGPESPVARFLDKRGEGIHHLSFEVDDVEAEIRRLRDAGFQMIDEKPRRGAGGALIAFVHPRSTGGVLIEICQHTEAEEH